MAPGCPRGYPSQKLPLWADFLFLSSRATVPKHKVGVLLNSAAQLKTELVSGDPGMGNAFSCLGPACNFLVCSGSMFGFGCRHRAAGAAIFSFSGECLTPLVLTPW